MTGLTHTKKVKESINIIAIVNSEVRIILICCYKNNYNYVYLDSSAPWYKGNFEPLFVQFPLYQGAASNFNALIPSRLICQTLANFCGVEF